ncbi:MAG: DUF1569 domain-containing protein [Flavobacteriales bacterium]|nr:DUF1569 domain-containing protein [Flavobacteriales bacterium]
MQNIFERSVCDAHIARINKLTATTKPQWGKMNAAQMLAHCSKPYEMVCDPTYSADHKRPNAVVRFLLKRFLKPIVVGPKPYSKNSRTAPDFIVADERILEVERKRIIDHINQVQAWGAKHFDEKDNHSFGVMTAQEWNNLFAKHIEHHLTQFGV